MGAWAEVGGRPVEATGDGDEVVRPDAGLSGAQAARPLPGISSADGENRPGLVTAGAVVQLWEVVEDWSVPRLPSYRSDATALGDELSRAGDAVALAELVTAVTATRPLAVGLFGDWQEGKSHFLGLMGDQVTAAAHPGNPLACSAVRQVRFNAVPGHSR